MPLKELMHQMVLNNDVAPFSPPFHSIVKLLQEGSEKFWNAFTDWHKYL